MNSSLNKNCNAGETNGGDPYLVKMKANRVAGGDKLLLDLGQDNAQQFQEFPGNSGILARICSSISVLLALLNNTTNLLKTST